MGNSNYVKYPYAEYDKKADALYIYLSGELVVHTKKLNDSIYADYASDDSLIGIEILYLSNYIKEVFYEQSNNTT